MDHKNWFNDAIDAAFRDIQQAQIERAMRGSSPEEIDQVLREKLPPEGTPGRGRLAFMGEHEDAPSHDDQHQPNQQERGIDR
jgi:hypothetical protein